MEITERIISMYTKEQTETIAHHAIAVVGGFFGVYALLTRSETFGSSETTNLIYLTLAGLDGSFFSFIVRLGGTLCYIFGIVFATLVPKYIKKTDFRYLSIGIDGIACLILAQIPGGVDPVFALYPMFFATSVQWLAYTQAAGYNSATIFSTNNLRQCFASFAEYLHSHDRKQLKKFQFYAGTLLCFHIGVIYCWFCMKAWGIKSIYACLFPLFLAFLATRQDIQKK
jgi:uncharacterized membrane protein YoaK (UPF0700 family)